MMGEKESNFYWTIRKQEELQSLSDDQGSVPVDVDSTYLCTKVFLSRSVKEGFFAWILFSFLI